MSEILQPYTEFDSRDLARQLDLAVTAGYDLLLARNITGPIARYFGDVEYGQEKVEKGQREHAAGQLGHYAIIGDSGDVIGAASLYPDLQLRKSLLPIPAGIARRVPGLSVRYPHASPNVHAWTNDSMDRLAPAYRELTELAGNQRYEHPVTGAPLSSEPLNVTWTFEPSSSPVEVHEAIVVLSHLEKVKTARFDDGEDGTMVPPRGTIYAQLRSDWWTAHGKQKELKTGRHSMQARSRRRTLQYHNTGK